MLMMDNPFKSPPSKFKLYTANISMLHCSTHRLPVNASLFAFSICYLVLLNLVDLLLGSALAKQEMATTRAGSETYASAKQTQANVHLICVNQPMQNAMSNSCWCVFIFCLCED